MIQTMEQGISIRQSLFDTNEELLQLVELQNEVYRERGLLFTVDSFKKWYLDNPLGHVLSFNAFDGDKMVAHYACIPTKMIFEGTIVTGLHSMATVTHPDYRGKGLFTTLAKQTIKLARELDYKYIIGVANANSFHAVSNCLGFSSITKLDVKIGFGTEISQKEDGMTRKYWDNDLFSWRLGCGEHEYTRKGKSLIGRYNMFVQTFIGTFDDELLRNTSEKSAFLPKLYVGTGAKFGSCYFDVPKFIKHSPFNLIFLDLTDGELPKITKDNIFFQLFDFDVA